MTKKKLISEVNQQFKASRKLVEPLVERRRRNLDLYTGFFAINEIENADGIRENVPYVKTLLDNTFPLLTARLPQSKVSPRNSAKYYAPAKLMNSLIDFTFDSNDFHRKFVMNVKESMLAGDHFTKIVWNSNPDKNYPLITSIDINNVSAHVSKLELDDEFPLFVRREMTKEQMKEETNWDHDTIDSLGQSKLGDKSYRMSQMQKLGLSPEKGKNGGKETEEWNLYEVIERWGMMEFKEDERKMGCVIVANGEHILNPDPFYDDLESYESPFANNVMPFSQLSYDQLPNLFFSMSFIDPIASQQIELNDLEAMKKSNYIRRNNPPIIVDKDAEVDLASLKFMAGLPWLVRGVTNIVPYVLPDLAPSIEGQQAMIRRTMMNVTGATDVLITAPDARPQGSQKVQSAAHAQMVQESVKTRFMPQAMNIDRYIERVGKLLVNLWQDKRYWVGMKGNKIALAISDDEGNNSITEVTNQMIQGELDFVVSSASSIAKSDTAMATQAANLLQLFMGSPFAQNMNFEPLIKDIFEKSGYDYNQIQKPKISQLPQLQYQLEQRILIMKSPQFKTMNPNQQHQLLTEVKQLQQQIAQLQKQGQQGEPQGQVSQNGQSGSENMSGSQLQPQAQQ